MNDKNDLKIRKAKWQKAKKYPSSQVAPVDMVTVKDEN